VATRPGGVRKRSSRATLQYLGYNQLMNPTAELNRITTNQVNRLKDDKNTIGVILFGSAVNGHFDDFSDIDLYCITSEKPRLSRESLYDAESNRSVEVLYCAADELNKYIEQEKQSVYRTVSSMLANGKVLYVSDDRVTTLMQLAAETCKSQTELTENQSTMIRYSLDDFYSDAQREHSLGHRMQFLMYADKLIQNAIEASLRVNGGYFESPKRLLPQLQTTDPKLYKLINSYAEADFGKQLDSLKAVQEYALSILGGALPKDWNVPSFS
jgi:predicted nucleotidyltransferase